jgi:DNA-directed RNA polymerase subunit H (RpoH/RPB5)
MSSSKSNRILSIYKSRKNILSILEENLFYNVKDYESFTINEIDAMYTNLQLDMLITNNNNNKIYIKYYLTSKQIRPQNLDDIIEDLFSIENVLTKEDTLVIIIDEEPNDTIINKVKYLYDHDGIFVVIHSIRRLQYNILKHKLVPECSILNDKEKEDLMKKYNVKDQMQFPEISRFDPQALLLCLRPGNICKFDRTSATALNYQYYRVCM